MLGQESFDEISPTARKGQLDPGIDRLMTMQGSQSPQLVDERSVRATQVGVILDEKGGPLGERDVDLDNRARPHAQDQGFGDLALSDLAAL